MNIRNNDVLKIKHFSNLEKYNKITHFISTRHGGVSTGNYATLNLSEYAGDDLVAVQKNREILCNSLEISTGDLYVPFQVHGDRIALLDRHFISSSIKHRRDYLLGVDALVTDISGITIAVSTADCVPILLYAPDKNLIAAVHAGWRGTVQRIVEKTVRFMQDYAGCDVKQMIAGIGPSISMESFEVGKEVVDAFIDAGMDIRSIYKRNEQSGKAHIDLWKANEIQLLDAGLNGTHIELASLCTYINHEDFFSARRLGINSGRFLSGIRLMNN